MPTTACEPGAVPFARLVRHARAARRMRFEVLPLLRNRDLARDLERALSRRPGIVRATADPQSGRLLILYRSGAEDTPELRRLAEGAPEHVWRTAGASPDRPEAAVSPHATSTQAMLLVLETGADGLAAREATRRLRADGPNDVGADPRTPWTRILLRQVANFPTALLVGSAGLSLLLGDVLEAGAILLVLGLNIGIGFEVERRSEALLAAWYTLDATTVEVLRNGKPVRIPSTELVRGDVMVCRPGAVVPADGRVLESDRLACDESALTGESEPRLKGPSPVAPETPLADRSSMVFAGTSVVAGTGRVLVTATAWDTEVAQVRALIDRSQAPVAPLERRMNELTNRASYVSLAAATVAGLASLAHGRPLLAVLRNSVALGVAAIPEGLPLVTTATLVRAMARLRRGGIVVRRLSAAETLGRVTVIAADKTGTLTENRMRVESMHLPSGPVDLARRPAASNPFADPATLALAGAVLNSTLHERHDGPGWVATSSTEQALVSAAEQAGLDVGQLIATYPRRVMHDRQDRVYFVVSVHDTPSGGHVAFVKGAPEQVIKLCDAGPDGPLDDRGRAELLARNESLAADGLRVLAVAWQPSASETAPYSGYTFLALIAMRDPLRSSARPALQRAAAAGIRTVILTGDQSATAAAIGRQLGLAGEVMDGREAQRWLADDTPNGRARLGRVSVFSRVTPSDKLAIVRALRDAGAVVAMAGDGVNDAPALKAADVSIAVGRRSTDLARQTAGVVLDGENLDAVVAAIGEGRVVHDNLHRTVRFLFATNLSEVALMLAGAMVGVEPLTALQLLWINLLTDTLPALALAFEPGTPGLSRAPSVAPRSSVLGQQAWRRIARDGVMLGAVGGLGCAVGGPGLAFSALPAAQLGYAGVCRAGDLTTPPSPRFIGLVGGAVALHATALCIPPLRRALGLSAALGPSLAGVAAVVLPWVGLRLDRWRRKRPAPAALARLPALLN